MSSFKKDIGCFTLTGEYEECQNKCDRYDGHLTLKLFLGKLECSFEKKLFMRLKDSLGVDGRFLTYPNFGHNVITYLYIREKDVERIWDESIRVIAEAVVQ